MTASPPGLPDALPDGSDDGVRRQQCGRCRSFFAGDPTLHAAAQAEWWLCDPCRSLLLPHRRPSPAPTT